MGISGLGTSNLVIASRFARRVYQQQTSKEHCTVMGCYSTTGACIPPVFLFTGKRVRQGLLDGAPPGSGVQVNESGWMTEELFYQWLGFFSASIPPTRPVLLIVDNHESRFSLRIIERCMEQQIILLLLPPNATHLMQVGDVAVHAPFKKAIRNQVGIFLHQHSRTTISKYHYAQIIAPAYTAAFSPSNIQSGYAATGIYPFSPDKVKIHLPSLPPSSSTVVMPLSEILSIPGQIQHKPSTTCKKRAGMPSTRILTSNQMLQYFQVQEQAEKQQAMQRLEKRRKHEQKKQELSSKPKRRYVRKQKAPIEKKVEEVLDKENHFMTDEEVVNDENESDEDYRLPAATASSSPLCCLRPSRNASQWARARICATSGLY